MKITWTHPVTLLALTTSIGLIGWAFTNFVMNRDRSALRFEVQNPTQAVKLVTAKQPQLESRVLYCDTAKLTLLMAHNGDGKVPIMINSISVTATPVPLSPERRKALETAADPLGARPFGIVVRNTYILTVTDTGVTGRYIESGKRDAAWTVSPDNILRTTNGTSEITLHTADAPVAFDIFVESRAREIHQITFSANYDLKGAKKILAAPFLLSP